MTQRWDINYRVEPERFVNRVIVEIDLVRQVANLIEGSERVSPYQVLSLAVLAECVVLNERIILSDGLMTSNAVRYGEYSEDRSLFDLLTSLEEAQVLEPHERGSASNTIDHELSSLMNPSSNMKVHAIHGSHVYYEWDSAPDDDWKEFDQPWLPRAEACFNSDYVALAKSFDCFGSEEIPWQVVANCHGVPYCSNLFYTLRDVSSDTPTNIGLDLYRSLEQLHESFFQRIRSYLGPTYFHLPPLLSMVLSGSRSREEIPRVLLQLRENFGKFRSTSTSLELDLRMSENLKDQLRIITEVERACESLAKRASGNKERMVYKLFDIVKNVDPIRMGLSALDQAKQYDVEREALFKIPGYYDLYNASLDVEQGLPLIQRMFGGEIDPIFIAELGKLLNQTGSNDRLAH